MARQPGYLDRYGRHTFPRSHANRIRSTRLPILSWRGAAGAAGYDGQRAVQPEGPWSTIASGINDAEVAYRPFYSGRGLMKMFVSRPDSQ